MVEFDDSELVLKLEADNQHVALAALEPDDPRTFELRVAGPAALLTAKAIKISERLDLADTRPDRLKEKDALDAFRILQAIDTSELLRGFALHKKDEHAAAVTAEAIEVYRTHASYAARPDRAARHQRRTRRPDCRASIRGTRQRVALSDVSQRQGRAQ